MSEKKVIPYGYKCPLCHMWQKEFMVSTEPTTRGRVLNCLSCESELNNQKRRRPALTLIRGRAH